jgi:hypothetical protein
VRTLHAGYRPHDAAVPVIERVDGDQPEVSKRRFQDIVHSAHWR